MTDRKRPGVVFCATAVAVVLLAYIASIGPVHWLASHIPFTNCQSGIIVLNAVYWPIWSAAQNRRVRRTIHWYVGIGLPDHAFGT
jgi:hypothetical protein